MIISIKFDYQDVWDLLEIYSSILNEESPTQEEVEGVIAFAELKQGQMTIAELKNTWVDLRVNHPDND